MGNKTPKGFTRATSKRRGDATFPLPLKKPPHPQHPPQPQHPSRGVWRLLRLLWVFPKGQRFQASSKSSDIVRRRTTRTRTRVEWFRQIEQRQSKEDFGPIGSHFDKTLASPISLPAPS